MNLFLDDHTNFIYFLNVKCLASMKISSKTFLNASRIFKHY